MTRNDETTTFAQVKAELSCFRDARDWRKFHTPQALSVAISVEAGELLDCYSWGRNPSIDDVRLELADVIISCLNMANAIGVDVAQAVETKMRQNASRYTIKRSRGNNHKQGHQ